tara:strand:- start:566 stop:778 length:213 start_codon:yes stop_codon:yes gene_type:complete
MQNSKNTQNKKDVKCCLCDEKIFIDPLSLYVYGNNPSPLGKNPEDLCCDICNALQVIPARLNMLFTSKSK